MPLFTGPERSRSHSHVRIEIMQRRGRGKVGRVGSLASLVILLTSCGGHGVADPGGRVLGELRPALEAVPAGVTNVEKHSA